MHAPRHQFACNSTVGYIRWRWEFRAESASLSAARAPDLLGASRHSTTWRASDWPAGSLGLARGSNRNAAACERSALTSQGFVCTGRRTEVNWNKSQGRFLLRHSRGFSYSVSCNSVAVVSRHFFLLSPRWDCQVTSFFFFKQDFIGEAKYVKTHAHAHTCRRTHPLWGHTHTHTHST